MPPGLVPAILEKSRPSPAREVTETPGQGPGAFLLCPRPIQMEAKDAQGGRLAAAVLVASRSVANAVSTPPCHGKRPSGTLGYCYIALFLAIYHLVYIAPAKLLYRKGAISILCFIATCYIAIL